MSKKIDLKIVGQIVSAIGILHIFPSEEKIGEFLEALLSGIPGCSFVCLCLHRSAKPMGSAIGAECYECARKPELADKTRVRAYPLETVLQIYGYLLLEIVNIQEYEQYEPFVRNLGNALAITLENRFQQKELQEERKILEQRVNKCTAELYESNEKLEQNRERLEEIVKMRTTELILARDAANSANKAKSKFLANMSHEIRTPMNAVLGFSQLLENDPSLSDDARDKVRSIMKSGEHLILIIDDILEMSRIEAGRIVMDVKSVNLHNLLEDLGVMFQQRAVDKGLSFTIEYADDLPRYIEVDPGKLRQVVINLLVNAVKFTRNGFIVMRALPIKGNRITIEINDTGIGITMEEQEKLFHPFERTRSGENEAGGTGLGLSISREYAHLMGGEITVKSTLGKGSSFRFEFNAPVTHILPVSPQNDSRVKALTPGQGEIRVLVVDDMSINRELLRYLLAPIGFIVDEACNAQEAISKVKDNLPRIIMMDLVMPGMNGIEATKIIRKICADKEILIIGISAAAFEEDRQNFINAGVDVFVAKPFRKEELYHVMALYGGVEYEYELVEAASPDNLICTEKKATKKMTAAWCDEFKQALAQGNITRIRRLGEEASGFDKVFSDSVIKLANLYDLNGLKKLLSANE